MRTIIILHKNDDINREILTRWLASFSDLSGIIIIEEKSKRLVTRIIKEIKRVGLFRLLDIVAYKMFYLMWWSKKDRVWREKTIDRLLRTFKSNINDVPSIVVASPNSAASEVFIKSIKPDIMIACCKNMITRRIYEIPTKGTFIMHPGVCPEYRNAHGCFWALANKDYTKVGMSLIKIDDGIDTGPVYGYFMCDFNVKRESIYRIQRRTTLENLEAISKTLLNICKGKALPVDTFGRKSNVWGQPWMTKYLMIIQSATKKHVDSTPIP